MIMEIVKCGKCGSEIAVETAKPFDIDCDCGATIKGVIKTEVR
jgi:DNA-directed RNA polymerase subunit RPC12/RpoP